MIYLLTKRFITISTSYLYFSMKKQMKVSASGYLVGVKASAYSFNNDKTGEPVKGTSYKATVAVDGDVFVLKTNEQVYDATKLFSNLTPGDFVISIVEKQGYGKSPSINLVLEEFQKTDVKKL